MRIFAVTACRKWATLLWPLMLSSTVLAANVVVLRPAANLHSAPNADAEVVSQAIYGANLEVLEDKNNWSRVRSPDEYTGWIHKAWVLRSDQPYAASGRIAKVTSLFASLYREASVTKHPPITTIPFETKLEVIGDAVAGEEKWLQIQLPDKKAAWMLSGDATLNPEKLSVREMVELSRQFLGLPYL